MVTARVMPCTFTGRKMFCAVPNFSSQPKKLTAFSASTETFMNINQFYWMLIIFLSGTIYKSVVPWQNFWDQYIGLCVFVCIRFFLYNLQHNRWQLFNFILAFLEKFCKVVMFSDHDHQGSPFDTHGLTQQGPGSKKEN